MRLPRPILRALVAIHRELNRDRVIARRRAIREATASRSEAAMAETIDRLAREISLAQARTLAMRITAVAMGWAEREVA